MKYLRLTLNQQRALLKLIDFYFRHRKEINGTSEYTEMDISIQAIRNFLYDE